MGFREWHRWQDILKLAHLVVTQRPGYAVAEDGWFAERLVIDAVELRGRAAGGILFTEVTQLDISATLLRERAKTGGSLRYLLPEVVCEYVAEVGLYD